MRITASNIDLSSQHALVEKDIQLESLQVWSDADIAVIKKDIAEISEQAKALYQAQTQSTSSIDSSQDESGLSDRDKIKILLIQSFIKSLTGKDIQISVLSLPKRQGQQLDLQGRIAQSQINIRQQPDSLGWGLRYNYSHFHTEQESMTFSAAGTVQTADGRTIDIAAAVQMSRSFVQQENIQIRAGDALKDPLVINFDGPAAQLTEQKFQFDIDSDGTADSLSFVRPGSGFLALDKNGDGIINNGKELFGADSGNGFADLAAYDGDGNGWIDENDSIYDKLRIWTKDAEGKDQLLALGAKGIGAIYVGNVSTEFALKDSSNQLQGQLRRSGIFLREDGSVGTMQQIDLAV